MLLKVNLRSWCQLWSQESVRRCGQEKWENDGGARNPGWKQPEAITPGGREESPCRQCGMWLWKRPPRGSWAEGGEAAGLRPSWGIKHPGVFSFHLPVPPAWWMLEDPLRGSQRCALQSTKPKQRAWEGWKLPSEVSKLFSYIIFLI